MTRRESAAAALAIAGMARARPSDASGGITLKRLRFQIADFQVLSGGESVTVSGLSIQVVTPITIAPVMTEDIVDFLVPAGTVVHTCATIDGQAWHGSAAATIAPFDIQPTTTPASTASLLFVRGDFPIALRTDDARCTPSTLQGGLTGLFGH